MGEWLKVFAPATVANVGPGFDVLGFAIDEPGDILEIRESAKPGVTILKIEGDGGLLSKEADKNSSGLSAIHILNMLKVDKGVEIKLNKNMPLGSGLGSSGASAVASAFAVNLLFGGRLSKKELIPACMEAERASSSFGHADNVAPSMLGGFVLIRSYNPLEIISLNSPHNLVTVVVTPKFTLNTGYARSLLPKFVPLESVVSNSGNLSAIISALYTNDIKLLGRAIDDKIVEPVRASMIPGFYEVKKAAIESGAHGCSISGAGPSVFAITDSRKQANIIGKSMQNAFEINGIASLLYISRINQTGAKVL